VNQLPQLVKVTPKGTSYVTIHNTFVTHLFIVIYYSKCLTFKKKYVHALKFSILRERHIQLSV